jgi:FKBP-type peptidyl-prolyl cis-trans isomerase FkpA
MNPVRGARSITHALPSRGDIRTMGSFAHRDLSAAMFATTYQRIEQMKHVMRPTVAALAVIAALGVAGVSQAQSKKSHASTSATYTRSQASELVGFELASQYPVWARDMVDPKAVGQAVTRALEGQKPTMSDSQLETVQKSFGEQLKARSEQVYAKVAAQEKQESDAYLARNKAQPGVHTTADGLQYQVISQGSGPRPTASDTVQINYTGSFVNGQEFDSSAKHGSGPASLDLGNVFPGFREALQLMPVGSHYKFVIPSDLAYGSHPKGGFIPPNAALIFDVTLVKIGSK